MTINDQAQEPIEALDEDEDLESDEDTDEDEDDDFSYEPSGLTCFEEMTEALQIFAKYGKNHSLSAEHDVFYIGAPEPKELAADDVQRLKVLGWRYGSYDTWETFV